MDALEFTKAYFNVCGDLGERPEHVVASSDGALAILGLKDEVCDLILDVRDIVYEACKFTHKEHQSGLGSYLVLNGATSLYKRRESVKTMRVRGVCIYAPDELLRQKEAFLEDPFRTAGKKKQDRLDIEALRQLLDTQSAMQ